MDQPGVQGLPKRTMLLPDLDLPTTIDTSTGDMAARFYEPALAAAVGYDRGVGFFSSGWLRMVARGMAHFAANGGRARIITSPILDQADWKALQAGAEANLDPILRRALSQNIEDLRQHLAEDTLSALAWMVADEILTFKLALPQNKLAGGDFHDKFGIFTDVEGDRVSFSGSPNESIQGFHNYESNKIFKSWEPAFAPLVEHDMQRFERLWQNEDANVRVYSLPEAAREQIIRLRVGERPYPEPEWVKLRRLQEAQNKYTAGPHIPTNLILRDYQHEAIEAWFANDCLGVLEMATGTGKTKTALVASVKLLEREKRLLIVIAIPYIHLITQWAAEVGEFSYEYLIVPGDHRKWQDALANELLDFQAGYLSNLVILTTHDTFANPEFWQILEQKQIPLLLIADEVHELGAKKRRLGLRDHYTYRLGLSATPERYFDDEGTDSLFSFFHGSVFKFSLADAIPDYLTPYDYYPFFVELDGQELEEYNKLTQRIKRRAFSTKDDEQDEILELYYILRQKIVVNAEAKYSCLLDIFSQLTDLQHTLVYCSPEQIDRVQEVISTQRVIQHRFTFEENLIEREKLLTSFAMGQHQVLVAMKCLDQGVDVPVTRNAIIMASTGNPKQFIQRRGRVLRKYPGKDKASIYDIIVVPTLSGNLDPDTLKLERKILRRELRRYNEFARLALNSTHALNVIAPIKRKYLIREDEE
jgi:superfamily II DNA or RNA helicase